MSINSNASYARPIHTNLREMSWIKALFAALLLATNAASAIEIDKKVGFRISYADTALLVSQPKPCKRPAAFSIVSMGNVSEYKGSRAEGTHGLANVDPGNWYRYLDLDGDGICEVEAETCNAMNAKDGAKQDSCSGGWFRGFKFRNGIWVEDANLHGGSEGEQFRGSATFKYFNKITGKIVFTAFHNFSSDTAGENFIVTYYGPPQPKAPGQGWPQSRYDSFNEQGPFKHNGAYIPFLDLHIQRLLAEYAWRVSHCGGKVGYRDVDSRTASLEQLSNMIGMFVVSEQVLAKVHNVGSVEIVAVKGWQEQVRKTLGISTPGDIVDLDAVEKLCAPKGGYHDIRNDVPPL